MYADRYISILPFLSVQYHLCLSIFSIVRDDFTVADTYQLYRNVNGWVSHISETKK